MIQGIETFTPRLLSIDSMGSLGSLAQFGSLYDNECNSEEQLACSGASCTWDASHVTVVRKASHPCNEYLQDLHKEDLLAATTDLINDVAISSGE